ncbi:hypothetical protein [Roseomonas chloroacetimidivorans]|jgi:hypothetical protein|uniref:hypothetical protein n=1 Tax=Roseomonas chloroacetimidivorans TaxID=1766656 RepID=UPI003C7475DA
MITLVVSNAHDAPDHLLEQAANYHWAFRGNLVQLVNINANTQERFWKEAQRDQVDFTSVPSLRFLPEPIGTEWGRIFHAFLGGIGFALRSGIAFDYVYFHTASDLLLKQGIDAYLPNYDLGFGKSHAMKQDMSASQASISDFWSDAVTGNPRYMRFIRSLGQDASYKARAEGCFFSRQVFFEMIFPLMLTTSCEDLASMPQPYPHEEFELASLVEAYCRGRQVRRCPNVVVTAKRESQLATTEDIDAIIATPDRWGIKRFPIGQNDGTRLYVRQIMERSVEG